MPYPLIIRRILSIIHGFLSQYQRYKFMTWLSLFKLVDWFWNLMVQGALCMLYAIFSITFLATPYDINPKKCA